MNKNRFLAIAAMAAMLCTASAQSKLSTDTKLLIGKQNVSDTSLQMRKQAAPRPGQRVLTTILLEKDANITDEMLAELDIKVEKRLKTMIFAQVPINQLAKLSEMKGVRLVDTGSKVKLHNDRAREATSVPMVHSMNVVNSTADVPDQYRGKGVLVAVIDFEIDLDHPAFRDAEGNTRIKKAVEFVYNPETKELGVIPFNEGEIDEAIAMTHDRECVQTGHGTHVAGIAAGSTVALPDDDPMKNYYGMAPEADLLVYDLAGVDPSNEIMYSLADAFQVAEERQQPLVVNMSLGVNSARLDGTDAFNTAMQSLVDEYDMTGKILCMSAGNEGGYPMSIQMPCAQPIVDGDWTEQESVACYSLGQQREYEGKEYYYTLAELHFYGADERAFAVKIELRDYKTNQVISELPLFAGDSQYEDQLFTEAGEEVLIQAETVTEVSSSNRYFHATQFASLSDMEVYPLITLYTKDEGMQVNASVNDNYFCPVQGQPEPNTWGSINQWVCNDNVISVGSYNTRNTIVTLLGDERSNEQEEGAISYFSSWCHPMYGSQKPLVTAPGSFLISAYNHNLNIYEDKYLMPVGTTMYNGTVHLWGGLEGTSMSSPVAAGIVALWLQANPTLTRQDVLDVMNATCDYDEYCEAAPERFGAGKINAKRGIDFILREAVGLTDIAAPTDLQPAKYIGADGRIAIRKGERCYNVVGVEMTYDK